MNNLHFSENAIRPEELVVKLEKLCEQDRALLMRHKEKFVAVTCPNMHGFDTSLLKTKSKSVGGEHLNLFNPESISILLERAGFKILSLETPGVLDAELVRKSILAGEYDISTQPFLKHILIDRWERIGFPFQKFLSENKLSSHMFVIARKCVI